MNLKINERTKVFVFEGRVCLEYNSTKLLFDEVDSFIEFLQKIFEKDEDGKRCRSNNLLLTINANGDKEWWLEGKRHRDDGPAIIAVNGNKYWYRNGKLHRTNGPAVEWHNGDIQYWIDGNHVTLNEYNNYVNNENQ